LSSLIETHWFAGSEGKTDVVWTCVLEVQVDWWKQWWEMEALSWGDAKGRLGGWCNV